MTEYKICKYCGKEFKSQASMYIHRKKCELNPANLEENTTLETDTEKYFDVSEIKLPENFNAPLPPDKIIFKNEKNNENKKVNKKIPVTGLGKSIGHLIEIADTHKFFTEQGKISVNDITEKSERKKAINNFSKAFDEWAQLRNIEIEFAPELALFISGVGVGMPYINLGMSEQIHKKKIKIQEKQKLFKKKFGTEYENNNELNQVI